MREARETASKVTTSVDSGARTYGIKLSKILRKELFAFAESFFLSECLHPAVSVTQLSKKPPFFLLVFTLVLSLDAPSESSELIIST